MLLPVIVIDVEVLSPVMMRLDNSEAGGVYRCCLPVMVCVMNSDRPFACSFSRWS